MKRILFLIVCLMPFTAKADMDKICYVGADYVDGEIDKPNDLLTVEKVVRVKKCERNNILTVIALPKFSTTHVIDRFCRYDAEVNYIYLEEWKAGRLTCVLYDSYPRLEKL